MKDLYRYFEIFNRRKFLFLWTVVIIVVIPLALSFFYKPVYKVSSKLRVLLHDTESSYAGIPGNVGDFEYVEKTKVDDTLFEMFKNEASLRYIASKVSAGDSVPLKPEKLVIDNPLSLFMRSEGFGVDYAGNDAEIIEVTGYSRKPERAVELANAAVQAFIDRYSGIYTKQAADAVVAMEKRLGVVNEALKKVEKEKVDVLQSSATVDVGKQLDSAVSLYYTNYNLYNQNLRDMKENAKKVKEVEETMKTVPEMTVSSKMVERNPLIDEYKKQIVTVESTIAKITVDLKEGHPDVIAARKQAAAYRDSMHKEIEKLFSNEAVSRDSYYTNLYQRYYDSKIALEVGKITDASLRNILDHSMKDMLQLKNTELSTAQIDRKIAALVKEYNDLMLGMEQAKLVMNMKPANVGLLNAADISLINTNAPFFPNRKKFLLISLALSLTLGTALVLITDHADNSIKTPEEFKEAFPANGLLGFECPKGRFGIYRCEDFVTEFGNEEWVRGTAWNIISRLSAAPGSIPKSILFTPVEKGAGATTIGKIVARELAAGGRRILFLDISSRTAAEGTGAAGISGALEQYVKASDFPGMDIITVNGRAAGMLMKEDFSENLKALSYDTVIIDSDSVVGSGRTVYAANFADTIALVAKFRTTSMKDIEQAVKAFGPVGDRQVFIALNGIHP
jgi:uncharacterized protein involved in exopolysaccharide biosynthesis